MNPIPRMRNLTPEQHAAADALIRAYRYAQLETVKLELERDGVKVSSRSALYRYAKQLRQRDQLTMAEADATVVTIVQRDTGQVTLLTTPLSAETIANLVAESVASARVS